MGCVSCTGHITHTTAGGLNDRRFLSLVLGPASETQVWGGRAPPRALSLVCGHHLLSVSPRGRPSVGDCVLIPVYEDTVILD